MARIKIKHLPKDEKISRNEMGRIFGGYMTDPPPVETTESGGTPGDKVAGFVDTNPSLLVVNDGTTSTEKRYPIDPNIWDRCAEDQMCRPA